MTSTYMHVDDHFPNKWWAVYPYYLLRNEYDMCDATPQDVKALHDFYSQYQVHCNKTKYTSNQ